MKHSESIALLAGALAKAQLQIEPASKNATNPHFRSHYADLASIWDACRGPLNTNGLSIVQFPCDGEVGRTGLCTMLLHSSGEFISEVVTTRSQKDDPQGLGSALTYLRRYALAAVVGVTATEDDDGNAASTPANARVAAPAARPFVPAATKAVEPVSMPAVNSPPPASKAVAKPMQTATSATDAVQAIVEFYKVDDGVGKNGRPYTKHRIGWTGSDGKMVYGTTFSASDGEVATESKDLGIPCEITYVTGQYGLDIKSIKMSSTMTMGVDDADIPF